jgi:hypothetical protein
MLGELDHHDRTRRRPDIDDVSRLVGNKADTAVEPSGARLLDSMSRQAQRE